MEERDIAVVLAMLEIELCRSPARWQLSATKESEKKFLFILKNQHSYFVFKIVKCCVAVLEHNKSLKNCNVKASRLCE